MNSELRGAVYRIPNIPSGAMLKHGRNLDNNEIWLLRDGPFNFQGGWGGMGFFLKKYSDFGGGNK
jgi:hypothetical protein